MRLNLRALKVVKGVKVSREVVLGILGKLSFNAIEKKLLPCLRGGGRRPEGSVGEDGSLGRLVSASDDDIRARRPE